MSRGAMHYPTRLIVPRFQQLLVVPQVLADLRALLGLTARYSWT